METLLALKNISKIFKAGDRIIGVENINLALQENELLAILGPSGSGKSTLLRTIAGLNEATTGEIDYRGQAIKGVHKEIKMVFQYYALLPWMTVEDNVALGLNSAFSHLKAEQKAAVTAAIKMVGLSDFAQARPGELSGGMCQRVGFARAFVIQPELLLLDEAFSALDALTARQLRRDFMQLWKSQQLRTKSVMMVTHDVREAVEMADRIVILAGTPSSIAYEMRIDRGEDKVKQEARVAELFGMLEQLDGAVIA